MSAWLRITMEVEVECPDDTTSEAAEAHVTTLKGRVQDATHAIEVMVMDWKLDS